MRSVFLFDGDCGFCTSSAQLLGTGCALPPPGPPQPGPPQPGPPQPEELP